MVILGDYSMGINSIIAREENRGQNQLAALNVCMFIDGRRQIDRETDWKINWQIDLQIDWQIDWLIDW